MAFIVTRLQNHKPTSDILGLNDSRRSHYHHQIRNTFWIVIHAALGESISRSTEVVSM